MVSTGLSDVIGSWNTIAMSFPRMRPHLVLIELQQITSLEHDFAGDDLAWGRRDQAQDRKRRDALPTARLTHKPQRLAFLHGVGRAVNCLDDALLRVEVRPKIIYLKKRHDAPFRLSRICLRPALTSGGVPHGAMGKRRFELLRLAAHDPKSCSSANSDTSPVLGQMANHPARPLWSGEPRRTRTFNLVIKSHLLCQLS